MVKGSQDYGLIVMADAGYRRADRRDKLPLWLGELTSDPSRLNLSTDEAVKRSRAFLKQMAQPPPLSHTSPLALEQLCAHACYSPVKAPGVADGQVKAEDRAGMAAGERPRGIKRERA